MSMYLGLIDELLRPDLLVLGGGLPTWAGDAISLVTAPCPLRLARLGDEAGMIGAALAFDAGGDLTKVDWRAGLMASATRTSLLMREAAR
jgi:hypothetical protein